MVRTAIFGLGNVAERIHLPACRAVSGIEVVAASEPRPERREEMRRRFDLPAVYGDCRELVEGERPQLVIVGTPPDSHRELCLLALRGGADVLCEKPFMPTLEAADEVIAEAREGGRLLAVNTQYRHMGIFRTARERIAAGEFGRLYFIQCWQQMFHPPSLEKLEWRSRLKRSTLYEFGTHALDLVSFFFDDLPESVSANIPRVRPELDSDVLVQAALRFPGERLATLAFNRVSHAPERYLEMRLDCEEASLRLSLGGVARASAELLRHRGRRRLDLRLSFVRGGEARIEAAARSRILVRDPKPTYAAATAAHLESLLRSPAGSGEPPWASAVHARQILAVALAGYESAAANGRPVELP